MGGGRRAYAARGMLGLLVQLVVCRGGCAGARVARDVVTAQGVVRGYLAPRPPHFAYLGLPYARPARQHRFKAPKPPRHWDGTFEAIHRVKCRQPDGAGTEDCLVVNVFAPAHAADAPVVVLVHGGGFQDGWGAVRPPTHLLAEGFLIVTFNYRVGVFGFLCLGVPDAPGNAGLKDQVAALYWVHRNIGNFGGRPGDITVYGIEAGAASVQFLLVSGAAKGLFHKVILESGSALSPLSLTYTPILTAINAAITLGYRGTDAPQDIANFYKGLPAKNLVNKTNLYLPCLENSLPSTYSLLERDPLGLLQESVYHMVPILIAYREGGEAAASKEDIKFLSSPESIVHLLPNNLEFDNDNVKAMVTNVIKKFYMGNVTSLENVKQNYNDYINDVTYEYPIIKSATIFSETNVFPVYLMTFSHSDSQLNILDYFNEDTSDKDEIKETRLITLWSNFIRIGDPTPLISFLVPEVWQAVKIRRNSDLKIKRIMGLTFSDTTKMKNLADNRFIFWDSIYNKFYKKYRALIR